MKFLSGIVINIWVTKGLEVAWLMCERQNSASLDWNVIFLLWSIRYTNKNQIRTKVQIFIYFSIHSPALLYIYIYLPISLSIYLSIYMYNIYIYMHIYIHIYIRVYIHIYMHVYIYTYSSPNQNLEACVNLTRCDWFWRKTKKDITRDFPGSITSVIRLL